ncbi:MAG: LysM peptidoglycan-binding domain-containing protein, partial [Rudaea sp.]|nr:LysM peptidoglycan-binding domain-containing protein [Rudaea sp.]
MAALVVCAVWLAGCASDPADVEDRSIGESPSLQSPPQPRPKPLPPGGSYRVVKGDTLYSIAFKRGLDYRDVAAWNGISAPEYKILVGQEIRFSPPGAQPAAVAARPVVASAAPVAAASAP